MAARGEPLTKPPVQSIKSLTANFIHAVAADVRRRKEWANETVRLLLRNEVGGLGEEEARKYPSGPARGPYNRQPTTCNFSALDLPYLLLFLFHLGME